MNVNTGSYYDKVRGNIGERRVVAGKQAIYADTFQLAAAQLKIIDFSAVKINDRDGINNGFIKCIGPEDIVIEVDLNLTGTVNMPEIKIKSGEQFDIGQFNGRIYAMSITNTSGVAVTKYTLVGE